MGRSWRTHAARVAIVVGLVVSVALGLMRPHELCGAAAWAVAVLATLYGLGGGVRRVMQIEVRLGEQLALGAIVWIFVVGVLLSAGIASRVPLFVVAGGGFALALGEIILRRDLAVPKLSGDERWLVIGIGVALAVYMTINLFAMIGTRGNPYDDHIAYTAFVKRMLDCGDLIEPFSFRRLSAYGGQTALLALGALRGDVQSTDMMDRGLFQLIAVLLVIDIIRRRKLHIAVGIVIVLFMLCLWDLSINSAATWTGFVAFTSAYAFASREDLAPRTSLVLTFAACGVACTLRQNYVLPAGLFGLLLLWFHLRATAKASTLLAAFRAERQTMLLAIAAAALVVVPYALAGWQSNGTPLYPIILGTWNKVAPLRPNGATFFDEASFFVSVFLKSDPLRVWWVLLPFMFLARDVRDRKPWRAFAIANWLGFAFLIHSFMLSDTNTLWRYGFGYMTPLALVFVIEIATALPGRPESEATGPVRLPYVATMLVWLALVAQTIQARDVPASKLIYAVENAKAAVAIGTFKADPRVLGYADMQRTIPEGARVAIWLDDPYLLDYDRNRIYNLDLPGFSSPGRGLPSFTTPEHWRAYFASQGIRYLMFVASDYSSYLFRRPGWLWRMFADDELWRYMAAHMVDTFDTLHALAASSTVLYHDYGLYAVDLGVTTATEPARGAPELERMDAYIRDISERELGTSAWQLASRRNVVFQLDSLGPSVIVPMPSAPYQDGSNWLSNLVGATPETPHRWLMDRTHIRVKGERAQHLRARVWVNKKRLFTTPTLAISIDGTTLARTHPDASGMVVFDVDTTCGGWCDVYIVSNTISEFWRMPDDLKALELLGFEWTEKP